MVDHDDAKMVEDLMADSDAGVKVAVRGSKSNKCSMDHMASSLGNISPAKGPLAGDHPNE